MCLASKSGLFGKLGCRGGLVILISFPGFSLNSFAQESPWATTLGERVETSQTDPAFQQGGWEAFRLAPQAMKPSWSWGDFSAQLAAVAQAFYDDNILQDNSQRLEDARFVLSPSLRLRWEPSTAPAGTGAEIYYSPDMDFFAEHSQYNTVNHHLGADLAGFFGSTTLELHNTLSMSSEPGLLQTQRNQTTMENSTLDATHELGAKTRLSSQFEAGGGDSGSIRYWETGGRLLLDYHVSERLAIGGGYGLRYTDFSEPAADIQMLINEPQMELLWAYTDRLHISLRGGAQFSHVTGSGASGDQTGPLVAGSLTYEASVKTDLHLELSHQRWPSYYTLAQLDELTQVSTSMKHRFSERISTEMGGALGFNTETSPVPYIPSAGSYRFWSVNGLLIYMISPHLDGALSYSHSERSASSSSPAFQRNILGARVTYRF